MALFHLHTEWISIWFSTWCSGTAYAIHFQANEWKEQFTCKIESSSVRFFAPNVPYLARRSTVSKLSCSFSMQLFRCQARSMQSLHICSRSAVNFGPIHAVLSRLVELVASSFELHSLTPLPACMCSRWRAFVFSINFTCILGRWQIAALFQRKLLKIVHSPVIGVVLWIDESQKMVTTSIRKDSHYFCVANNT